MASEFRQKQTDICAEIPKEDPLKKICPTCKPNPNFIEPNWITSTEPFLNEKNCEYEVTVDTNESGDVFTAQALAQELDLDTYLRSFVIPGIRIMLRYYNKLEINQLLYAAIPGLTISGLTAEELLQAFPTFDSAFERLESQPEPSVEDLAASVVQIPEKTQVTDYTGDTYDVFRLDAAILNNPAITNPFALELYAYAKDFDIDPITGLGKVRVAIPAFIFDKVPEAPGVEDLQEEAAELKDFVEIKAQEAFAIFTRFSTSMKIFGSYHAYWFSQNRESEIQYKASGDPYYAKDYAPLSLNFFNDLAKLAFANMPHTELYKIKIEFDNSNPNNQYVITNIKGRLRGCKYQDFKKGGIENFKQKYSTKRKTTLMGYVAKINEIDIDLTARQSFPWLDFIMKYTFPVIHINYGALSQQNLQKNGLGCVVDNMLSEGENIRDYILDETLSLSQILQYEFNTKNCASLNDPTNQPEFKFNVDLKKPFADAKKAKNEAKQAVQQEYQVKIEEIRKEIDLLRQKADMALKDYNRTNAEYAAETAFATRQFLFEALRGYNQQYRSSLEQIKELERQIELLEKEARRKARREGRRAANKALMATGTKSASKAYNDARIEAVERFTSQSNFLESIIDLEQFGNNGSIGLNADLFQKADKQSKGNLIRRMSLCNVRSLSTKSVRCLLSGVTYEAALRKLIKTALEAYDIDLLGVFIEGLPPEEQFKLRQQFEKEFGNLPLPWEGGYDPGSLSNTNPYIKYKSRVATPEQQMVEAADKVETKKEKQKSLEAKIADVDEEIYELEEREKVVDEAILYTLQQIAELETELDQSGITPETLSIITQKQAANASLKSLKKEQDSFDSQFGELQQKKFNLQTELDDVIKEVEEPSAEEKARLDQFNSLSPEEQEATREQLESQKTEADARSVGVTSVLKGDPSDPTTPGTYGNSLANMQQQIADAYIRYVIDLVDLDVALERLERLPGSPVIQRIIASANCSFQGLFYPPIDSFLSTLSFDPCGDNKGGIQIPAIPKIPTFFDTSFLNVVKKKFMVKVDDVLTQVLTGMFIKLLQVVDDALCKSVNAVGQFVAAAASGQGVGLEEAFNDAFCPDGDEAQRKQTRDAVFSASGINEIKDHSFDAAFRSMSSVLSGKEAAALFSKSGPELDPNVLNRVASVINAFHPEFSEVLGNPDDVRDVFTKTQKFIPLNVREDLRRVADSTEDAPIYNNICLTKDEYDKWNNDRVNLLTDKGLDENLAQDIIDKANDRALNDLEDVSAIIQKGPDGLLQDALDDLLGFAEDPSCSVNKSAITFESEDQAALKKQLINDYFKNLEKAFLKDIIGDFSSIMQNILRDKNNQTLAFHEFYANFPIFFPNYVNSREHWDLRKETAGVIIESFMEEDKINGVFPETVGIHMKNEIDKRQTFRTSHTNSGNFKLKFQDRKNGETDDDFSYGFDLRFFYDFDNPFQYRVKVDEKYKDSISKREAKKLGIEEVGGIYEITATDKIMLKDISQFSGSIERLTNYELSDHEGVLNQALLFRSLVGEKVSNLRFDDQLLSNVFDYQTTSLFNFVKRATGETADGGVAPGYSFGYDANQTISSIDLKYVNPEADPNDPDTWEYTYEEEEAVMGKSATENPRVHFLSPSVYGGSYRRPQIYVEPAVYNGWMSLIQTFVPEVEPCGDRDTNFLEIASIRDRVKFLEDNIPMDERLSVAPECRDERPYDKLAAPTTHALMEGIVIATVRVYATEFILRTMPIFSSVEYNINNVDDTLFDIMVDEVEKGIKNETAWFAKIQGFTYWLFFLEQAVMAGQRQFKDGLLEDNEALQEAFNEIGKVEARYWAEEPNAVLNGAALAAYGEEFQIELQKPLVKARFDILLGVLEAGNSVGLASNLTRYASKLYNLYESQDAAKVILRSLVKKEFQTLVEKVNFNMRPRPHVFDINKYLLSKNGFVFNSNIRAGEQVIESPTVENASVPDYGTVQNVVEDIQTQNPLDGIELELAPYNLALPGGDIVEFLTADLSLTELPSVEDIQNKLISIFSPLQNGFFYMEKYVRTIEKDGTQQVHTVGQFQDLIRNSGFDPESYISDHFGDAQIVNDEMIGSIGVKYGVRLCYVMPKDATYTANMNFAKQERSYRFKAATAAVKIPDSVVNLLPSPIKEVVEPYTVFEFEGAFRDIVPVISYERDLPDYKIEEIDLQDQDLGQDIKCYVDKMTEEEDYKMLFDYIFPSKSFVSVLGIYSFFGFFASIGEADDERDRTNVLLNPDAWQDKVFNDTRKRLRKMFASAYKSDDDAYDDEEEGSNSRDNDRRFLKNILPRVYLNLDSDVNWFMRRRIIAEKPFDSDGKPCKSAFQKLFEDG